MSSKQPLTMISYIGALPDKVWDTLMEPEGCKQLFFGSVLESSLVAGEPYAYVGPGTDGDRTVHVYGTVLACDRGKLFMFSEHPGPSYRSNHEELETRVSISLEQVGNSTKLTLVNDQWPDNHPGYEKAGDSWATIISNLKTLAESGRTLDLGW